MSTPNQRAAALVAAAAVVTAMAAAPSAQAKPVRKSFAAHGVVVSHTKTSVKVLAYASRTGSKVSKNHTVTVALPSTKTSSGRALAKRVAASHAGDSIDIAGVSTGSGKSARVVARSVVAKASPFHLYLGVVTKVSGGTLFVDKADDRPSDDERESGHGRFTVNTSDAVVTVDGAAASDTNALAAGQVVAMLGSESHDVVKATSIWAYSTAPAVLGGKVQGIDGTMVTLGMGAREGDDNGGGNGDDRKHPTSGDDDDMPNPVLSTTVDLTDVALIVDGNSGGSVTDLAVGAKILVLGSADADGVFTASLAIAFTKTCSSRSHGDGGRDEGGRHGGDDNGGDNGGGDDNGNPGVPGDPGDD